MLTSRETSNAVRFNWWLDLTLFVALMLSLTPALTGLTIHEWLGLALAAGVAIHLLLHWPWLAAVLRRFIGGTNWPARFNLILNAALFIAFTVVVFTGILISREALPLFGLTFSGGRAWESLHHQASDLLLFLAALHVAIHWKWILNAFRRYVLNPAMNLGHKSASATSPTELR
ncbi:MAG: DUF4405 domain-containing protein [Anaerolineales bacterium]|nr:DUF4405 domain-containing protein [Anaerolineales bacterium]